MGQSFTDTAGHSWTVEINVDAVKRVKAALEIDLLETATGPLVARFVNDPVLLCDVLFVLCQKQADAQGITAEDFGRAMGGDVLDDATAAFLEGIVLFFPSQRRAVLQKALAKTETLRKMALAHASEVLDSDQLDRQLAEQLATIGPGGTPSPPEKDSGDPSSSGS